MIRSRTFLSFAFLGFMAGSALADWKMIGDINYEFPYQQAILNIGKDAGLFEAIRIDVKGADVEVLDLKILYGNGEVDDIRVRESFRAGSSSRRIELKRGNRHIKQIYVFYRANGPARIAVLGDVAQPKPQWFDLGCKTVKFGVDRDLITVGREEGAFTKLKLSVFDNAVEFYDVRVVYGNGQAEVLRIRSVIRPNQKTRDIDLSGKYRGIKLIDMVYRSVNNFKGSAKVCASGLVTP